MKILKTVSQARTIGYKRIKFLPNDIRKHSFGLWYWTILW